MHTLYADLHDRGHQRSFEPKDVRIVEIVVRLSSDTIYCFMFFQANIYQAKHDIESAVSHHLVFLHFESPICFLRVSHHVFQSICKLEQVTYDGLARPAPVPTLRMSLSAVGQTSRDSTLAVRTGSLLPVNAPSTNS